LRSQRRGRMQGGWTVLLLGLAGAMPRATAQTQGLSHAEALAIAVDNYNQDSAEENVFRLLSAEPRPEWDADLGTPQVLNFTIQETVCPKAESPTPERCDFKADGLVKDCLGSISTGGGPPAVVVTCEPKDGVSFSLGNPGSRPPPFPGPTPAAMTAGLPGYPGVYAWSLQGKAASLPPPGAG
uniref:Uncharacterized protein n=1 Tax=Ornithorhynchus anatinus TaxID=9258 RepID=A0A6I8PM85_ORNAN